MFDRFSRYFSCVPRRYAACITLALEYLHQQRVSWQRFGTTPVGRTTHITISIMIVDHYLGLSENSVSHIPMDYHHVPH